MPEKMGITGKTGDDGYTGLLDGKRLRKDHPVIECLGTLDELNAFLGDAKTTLAPDAAAIITGIQKDLFSIMGILAGTPVPAGGVNEARLDSLIAELEASLPPFTSFALPGANPASAKLHIARTVCRRAERRLIALNGEAGSVTQSEAAMQTEAVTPYINRLSDLLFLLAEKQ